MLHLDELLVAVRLIRISQFELVSTLKQVCLGLFVRDKQRNGLVRGANIADMGQDVQLFEHLVTSFFEQSVFVLSGPSAASAELAAVSKIYEEGVLSRELS